MVVTPISDELDDFSRSIAALIADIRPEWLPLCQVVDGDDGRVIELAWNSGRDIGPVVFSTDAEEITVFIGDYHQHFGYREQDIKDTFAEAVELVDNFIMEHRVTVLIKRDGKPRLGQNVAVEVIDEILSLPTGDHELIIRSWSGRFDSQRPINWQSYLDHVFNQRGVVT